MTSAVGAAPRPEIVIGLVGALGTELTRVEDALAQSLMLVGYQTQSVKVSDRIASAYRELGLDPLPAGDTPIDELMDLGDALRSHYDDGAIASAIAISAISEQRFADLGEGASGERDGVATIVRQLKHPHEVQLLRSAYGPRFVLLGAWSPKEERRKATVQRLRALAPNRDAAWYEQQVPRLMGRDEKDGAQPLGQRVRDTFELADAYVALRTGQPIEDDVGRIVRLLFGHPFETPTRDEQAMFQAFGARLRSSAPGRQVGAVAIDHDGELLASGTNDVPKAQGGQYWTGDRPDNRDFQLGSDFNDGEKLQVVANILQRLKDAGGWLSDDKDTADPLALATMALQIDGPFAKSRIADLLEFGRVLHAEMALICTAARRGTPLGGTTMYTTTYPCHECARLIIGAGINRLVYIDPYPKSLVPQMYENEVGDGEGNDGKVAFEAFAGVAPRLFPSVFAMTGRDRDDVTGAFLPWIPAEAMPRMVDDSVLRFPIQQVEDEVTQEYLSKFGSDGEPEGEDDTCDAKVSQQ